MPLGETEAKVFSRSEREHELERRVFEMLSGKPPQALMIRGTEKKLLLQRLREQDRPTLASDRNRPPP
jgi:hypothetical protein